MKWLLLVTLWVPAWAAYTEKDAIPFIEKVGNKTRQLWSVKTHKEWDYSLSFTDDTKQELTAAQEAYDNYQAEVYPELIKYPWKSFKDPLLKRQFKMFAQPDEAALTVKKRTRLSDVKAEMIGIYSKAMLKEYKSANSRPSLTISDISAILSQSNDSCKNAYYWDGWHTTVGRNVKTLFQEYVKLINETAILNNYTDNAARWQARFETTDFEGEMARLLGQIRPLFLELHAYIRYKLWLAYGKDCSIIDLHGPIPASLLGNLWGLDAVNIFNVTAPYRNKPSLEVSPQLVAQKYTGLKIAKAAEQFYISLNMSAMKKKFWKYSVFERPATGAIDCSATAYTLFGDDDYRVRICARPTMDYFGQMHHEMGHIENYMLWDTLPWAFQDAPNPGFNEAIGDMIYMYATSPTHLKNVGLLDPAFQFDEEQEINALYQQAVGDVFFLPYAHSLDAWRWKVFQGKITSNNYNCEYWKIRLQEQGVEPPVDRDENDFDPGAKQHVLEDYQYISYFVSGILKFQFHRSLCITAKQFDPNNSNSKPLYLCDIYQSKDAGNRLKKMMALGRSLVWQKDLEIVTGQRTMDAGPLLEFYDPLYKWLVKENKKNKQKTGWTSKHRRCSKTKVNHQRSGDQCRYSYS